jgi:hypothetical protein
LHKIENSLARSTLRKWEIQAQPFAAHVLPLALTDEVLVPARKAVDAAPGDLLFRRHEAGDVIGR